MSWPKELPTAWPVHAKSYGHDMNTTAAKLEENIVKTVKHEQHAIEETQSDDEEIIS